MLSVTELRTPEQTIKAMYRLVNLYSQDLQGFSLNNIPLSSLPFNQFFEVVKNIPFTQDKKPVEIITRPEIILDNFLQGADCKKKSILIASWLKENFYPFRFKAVSSRIDGQIHHVITEALINNEWLEIDPTYNTNILGQSKNWTNSLSGNFAEKKAFLVTMSGPEYNYLKNSSYSEKYDYLNNQLNPYIGNPIAGIIAAIIAAVSAITTTIISAAVNYKNREAAEKAAAEARQGVYRDTQIDEMKQQILQWNQTMENETTKDTNIDTLFKTALPAAAGAGIFALTKLFGL